MKFSIITVCYNNRDGLEKTIKSVFSQTCKDYECIIIDGGSKDGTKELLEHNNDKIDFWCSEPDNGVYNAMNKGLSYAHGDYVIFMNSDAMIHDCSSFQIEYHYTHKPALYLTDDPIRHMKG